LEANVFQTCKRVHEISEAQEIVAAFAEILDFVYCTRLVFHDEELLFDFIAAFGFKSSKVNCAAPC
jgi:hypothetical protein